MSKKPNDLITVKEASKMSAKSVSSIRSWVRQKKLTGHKKNPKNKNSALMVSESELRTFLALNGKITSPNIGRSPDFSASIAARTASYALFSSGADGAYNPWLRTHPLNSDNIVEFGR